MESSLRGVSAYTAPGVLFTNRESLRAHYTSDWHRYNLKRKVAGLAPLVKDEFEARKAAALLAKQDKDGNVSKKQDHVKSSKQEQVARRNGLRRHDIPPSNSIPVDLCDEQRVLPPVPPPGTEERLSTPSDEEDQTTLNDEPVEINVNKSLFDNHESVDVHENLEHMQRNFDFFLPDAEYVSDLEGLLEYLHQKVSLGHTCLYCGQMFRSAMACRQHMIDKSHCKIKYDEQEDMDEFGEFYDFSSSYADASDPRRDVVSEDEDEDDEVLVGESNSFEMLPGGELLLKRADGTRKIIGVRWLKQYYKQNARVIDQRASVIAAQREKLLLMYKRIGVDTSSELIKDLIAAGAENNQQQSRALSVALNRAAPRFAGVELAAARQHFKREHKQRTKLGMQENWNIKHRVAKQRSRAEGVGVHG